MRASTNRESGVIMLAIFAALIPMIVLVGTVGTALKARNSAVRGEADLDRALLAAESGIDMMVYETNTDTITLNTPVSYYFPGGMRFTATATDLLTDGVDNDGDGFQDEADEEAIKLQVVGRYRNSKRTLVAYVRKIMEMPTVESAVSFQDFSGSLDVQIDPSGNAFTINGNDHKIDGSPGTGAAVPGVVIADPGIVSNLLQNLNTQQLNNVTGAGPSPSAAVTTTNLNIADLTGWALSIAHNNIPPGTYNNQSWNYGDAANGDWQVTLVDGDLDLSGNVTGAGILVVTGDLEFSGTLSYTGLVIVAGDIEFKGGGNNAMVRGGLVAGANLTIKGTVDIQYSTQTIQEVATKVATKRVVTGWREAASY